MSDYSFRLSRVAEKGLARLDPELLRRIGRRLEQLCENPRDPRLTRELVNRRGLRRTRVGAYRIVFRIDDEARMLFFETIAPRGEAYE